MEPINLKTFQEIHHAGMIQGIEYGWGEKPDFDAAISEIHRSDCSGWSRYLIYHSTDSHLELPEGSVQQREYLQGKLERVTSYAETNKSAEDATLYIAFINPTTGANAHVGHVFFVCRGETYECYGGNGVGSRSWNSRPLPQEVSYVFKWPHVWK